MIQHQVREKWKILENIPSEITTYSIEDVIIILNGEILRGWSGEEDTKYFCTFSDNRIEVLLHLGTNAPDLLRKRDNGDHTIRVIVPYQRDGVYQEYSSEILGAGVFTKVSVGNFPQISLAFVQELNGKKNDKKEKPPLGDV